MLIKRNELLEKYFKQKDCYEEINKKLIQAAKDGRKAVNIPLIDIPDTKEIQKELIEAGYICKMLTNGIRVYF